MRRALWLSCCCAAALAQAPAAPTAPPPLPPAPAIDFAAATTPPRGLPALPTPPGGAPRAAVFELGRRLFADPVLSSDRTVACSSCHLPEHGYGSPEALPAGIAGHHARRHPPTLFNRAWSTRQRWDGSTPDLESFVLQPIADADEMGLPVPAALQRLRDDPGYGPAFAAAFADGATAPNLAQALATFVRGITRGDSAYDRFVRGDAAAFTPAERQGFWLFESKGGCWRCHTPPLFTDESFHATGVGVRDGRAEAGRAAATGDATDTGAFKTPTLRGASLRAPYMHDGSLATLEDVVAFYDRGGNDHPQRDARMRPLALTPEERTHLVAFLRSL